MKILVPVDGSKYSMEGAKAALDIGRTKNADIILMTVTPFVAGLDLEMSAKETDNFNNSMKNRGEEVIRKAEEIFTAEGISTRSVLASSISAADEIINTAEKEKADLIVIGSLGMGGSTTRFFMGSVASKVVSHAPCSVLVVKLKE